MDTASEPFTCKDCHRMFLRNDSKWHHAIDRRRLSSLREGQAMGCQLCNMLTARFYDKINTANSDNGFEIAYDIGYGGELEKKSWISFWCLDPIREKSGSDKDDFDHYPWDDWKRDKLTVFITAEESDPAGEFIKGRTAQVDVTSARSFETMKTWISSCQNHKSCPSLELGKLPKRLINVSSFGIDATVKVQQSSHEQVLYVALSYCWGAATHVVTTSANFQQYSKSIFVSDLPKTIQDAIFVTSRLGFEYLWVDSLCIIQDNNPEKAEDIAGMADIYRFAALTIIAASAENTSQGFLQKRESIPFQPGYLKPYYNDLMRSNLSHVAPFILPFQVPEYYGSNKIGRITVYPNHEQPSMYQPEPISQRAWAFQESVLSPRCLIFATSQVYWKCSNAFWKDGGFTEWETFKTKSGCWSNVGLAYTSSGLASFGRSDFITLDNALHPARTELARRWTSVATAYSERLVTISEDKLPAFSSIAAIYHSVIKEDYLAGLWRSTVLSDLLWKCDSLHNSRPDRVCPTWSWLSVDRKVNFEFASRPKGEWQHMTKLLDCTVTPLFDFAPFGQLKVGSKLEVMGPTFVMTLKHARLRLGWEPYKPSFGGYILHNPSTEIHMTYYPDVKTEGRVDTEVRCLIISRTNWQRWTVAGLVLAPVRPENDVFERIGYFEAGPGLQTEALGALDKPSEPDMKWILKSEIQKYVVL